MKIKSVRSYSVTCLHMTAGLPLWYGSPMQPNTGTLKRGRLFSPTISLSEVSKFFFLLSFVCLSKVEFFFQAKVCQSALFLFLCRQPCFRDFLGVSSLTSLEDSFTTVILFLRLFPSFLTLFIHVPWALSCVVNSLFGTGHPTTCILCGYGFLWQFTTAAKCSFFVEGWGLRLLVA